VTEETTKRRDQRAVHPAVHEQPARERLDLSVATDVIGERMAAELVDNALLFGLYWGVAILFGGLSLAAGGVSESLSTGGFLVTILVAPLSLYLYNVVLEGWWNGQTIGKRLVGLRVVREDGSPVTPLRAGVRGAPVLVAVLGTVGALLFVVQLTVALVFVAVTDENQRLFDMLAGTVVVDEDAL
jgi:uncharacterized RDD family membrane protein YckC